MTKTPRFHFFFSPHQSQDTILSPLISPRRALSLCLMWQGLKLLSERSSVEPCYHVHDEVVPILEPPVQHRLAILRQIILMEGSEALKIPAEEYDCLPCQEACLGGVSVPEEPTEDEIVDTYPYRPLPRRGVPLAFVLYIFSRGERERTPAGQQKRVVSLYCRATISCACCGVAMPAHRAMNPLHTLKRCMRQSY